ncbi:MAG: hypothetical protein ACP5QO_11330 [Clostridia bacterium]
MDLAVFGFVGPSRYRGSPYSLHITSLLKPQSISLPLGTSNLGRNMLARLMLGGQTPEVGFASALAVMTMGVVDGLVAGYAGGVIDAIMMRIAHAAERGWGPARPGGEFGSGVRGQASRARQVVCAGVRSISHR